MLYQLRISWLVCATGIITTSPGSPGACTCIASSATIVAPGACAAIARPRPASAVLVVWGSRRGFFWFLLSWLRCLLGFFLGLFWLLFWLLVTLFGWKCALDEVFSKGVAPPSLSQGAIVATDRLSDEPVGLTEFFVSRTSQGVIHHLSPDRCWTKRTGDGIHLGIIIVANPYPNGQTRSETNSPSVAVILGGTGFYGGEPPTIEGSGCSQRFRPGRYCQTSSKT